MSDQTGDSNRSQMKIIVRKNGPYTVVGNVPLVHKTQVVTQYGEPITWRKDGLISTESNSFNGMYDLCRCGQSKNKPFCDASHRKLGFDGTETAFTNTTEKRRTPVRGGPEIFVRQDMSVCINSGFCGNRLTNLRQMAKNSGDTAVLSQIIAMIERCPSGSFTYSLEWEGPDIEVDLPQAIAVTTEMTDAGPIMGALWVTGGIPVERADGEPFQTRNRMTLCRCGLSRIKPLCDGTHRAKNVPDE